VTATPERVVRRLLANFTLDGFGCMVSGYSTGSHGYSQIGWSDGGRTVMRLGHRVAWEAAHGPIPEGMTIDHMCRNRRCINVEHMRLLRNEVNAQQNDQSTRSHCPHGHAYTHANTYVDPRGHRRCRACATDRRRAA